jgi:tyrosyl-tRNA synthetase
MDRERLSVDKQVALLLRGCEHVYTVDELRARIASGKRLRAKLGMDPTAPR